MFWPELLSRSAEGDAASSKGATGSVSVEEAVSLPAGAVDPTITADPFEVPDDWDEDESDFNATDIDALWCEWLGDGDGVGDGYGDGIADGDGDGF